MCDNCGAYGHTEEHHVFYGRGNRKICDNYVQLKVRLCYNCHRGTNGVHGKNGRSLDIKLKQQAQLKFEEEIGKRQEFIKLFGRNYL